MGRISSKKIHKKRRIKRNPYRKITFKTKRKQAEEFIPDAWYIQIYKNTSIIDTVLIIQFDHYTDNGTPMFNEFDDRKFLIRHFPGKTGFVYIGPFYSHQQAYDHANREYLGLSYLEQRSSGILDKTIKTKKRILGHY